LRHSGPEVVEATMEVDCLLSLNCIVGARPFHQNDISSNTVLSSV
jgi:hypothetical protein